MHVEIDRDRCVGSGFCALTVPAVFDQDQDDGLATLVTGSPEPALEPAVREVAGFCPVAAIVVR